MQTIAPSALATLRGNGKARDFIDVRTPAEYESVHAEGARSAPLDALDPSAVVKQRVDTPDQPIYVICASGARGAMAVAKLTAAGVAAINVEGGTTSWEAAGLPVQRGRKMMSLERQVRIVAGSLVVVGVALGWLVHPAFYILSAFVGAGLVFAGVTNTCGMGMMLAKMPWNR